MKPRCSNISVGSCTATCNTAQAAAQEVRSSWRGREMMSALVESSEHRLRISQRISVNHGGGRAMGRKLRNARSTRRRRTKSSRPTTSSPLPPVSKDEAPAASKTSTRCWTLEGCRFGERSRPAQGPFMIKDSDTSSRGAMREDSTTSCVGQRCSPWIEDGVAMPPSPRLKACRQTSRLGPG